MFENPAKICIITDLDGTFLPKSKVPLPVDLEAVRRFEEAGGMFTIATGRTVQASRRYPEELGLKRPIITFNGAGIWDPIADKLLYVHPMPESAKEDVKKILAENPHVGSEVLGTNETWVVSDSETERDHIQLCGITPKFCPIDDVMGETWLKVLFAMHTGEMPDFVRYIDERSYEGVDFVRSEKRYYEILPAGVSKGSALQAYRELPGMEGFTFVAVGDYNNDIEMLKAADFAVCPQNATPDAKAVADLVLDRTCEEGAMAELIGRILDK
ncbi:MAG: HAD-IIB family hydrolase [Oscillospiraceae bacterium]|nr:HAD-IIB family hydrolase [Oscillospiraceae bacterium]